MTFASRTTTRALLGCGVPVDCRTPELGVPAVVPVGAVDGTGDRGAVEVSVVAGATGVVGAPALGEAVPSLPPEDEPPEDELPEAGTEVGSLAAELDPDWPACPAAVARGEAVQAPSDVTQSSAPTTASSPRAPFGRVLTRSA